MALGLSEYRWTQPRRRNDGLRLGCTRYLPRGVRKADYARDGYFDVWMPALSPSAELVHWAQRADLRKPSVWRKFKSRYRKEMSQAAPRQTIAALAQIAKRTPISVGCGCAGPHCHRFELVKLIRAAAGARALTR